MKSQIKSDIFSIEEIPLSNGSRLYFKHLDEAPRIAMGIYIHGGNRIEPLPGVADMVDDLLCEGTGKRTAEEISIALDSFSLDMDTDTRRDYSIMNATFLDEDTEASIEFLSDMLFNSTMEDFDKEKIRLHGELMMQLDSPRNRSHDLLMTHLFKETPYRASHTNIIETIPTLTSSQSLIRHYEETYQPENMIFSLVGNVDIEAVKTLLESYFVRGRGKNLGNLNPPEKLSTAEELYVTAAKDDSNQLHVFKGWFAPKVTHPDYFPMVVLNTILGGAGLTSRLFIELRDKQGLAYNVRSQYEASRYAGLFSLYIGTDPNNREKVLNGFKVECQKLLDNPVEHKELEEAKENILGRRVVFLETASQQCSYIGTHLALGVSLSEMDSVVERIRSVTALEVQEIAQKYLSKPSIVSAVGPSKYL